MVLTFFIVKPIDIIMDNLYSLSILQSKNNKKNRQLQQTLL